jgi:hypothetical protein
MRSEGLFQGLSRDDPNLDPGRLDPAWSRAVSSAARPNRWIRMI